MQRRKRGIHYELAKKEDKGVMRGEIRSYPTDYRFVDVNKTINQGLNSKIGGNA